MNSDTNDDENCFFKKKLNNKKILIAGAAGFVPSTVAQKCLEMGAIVIGLDNFITGSKSNIKLLEKYDQFTFIEIDISSTFEDKFEDKLKDKLGKIVKFDYVLSLASPASPIDFKKIPLEIMQVNSMGTKNLLEISKRDSARFLEASTSEVYGDPEIHPQVEDYFGNVNPIGIRSCYDESKRFAEALTMSYHRMYNVNTSIIRIFNTYGPRMRPNDGRVIPNFINQALQGKDLTIYGDGSQTRSFCYVDDLVRAILYVLCSNQHLPVNVGNPDEYTILETANFIIQELNSKSTIKFCPIESDDPKKRKPNISRLQSFCDYSPSISFKNGIHKTSQFFKKMK